MVGRIGKIITAALFLSASLGALPAWAVEIIQNGSFETGISPWLPGVNSSPDPGDVTLSVSEDAATGLKSLRVTNNAIHRSIVQEVGTRASGLSNGPVTARLRLKIDGCTDQRYKVTAWLKSQTSYLLISDSQVRAGSWYVMSGRVNVGALTHPNSFVEILVEPLDASPHPSYIIDDVSVATGISPAPPTGTMSIRRPFSNAVVLDASNIVDPDGSILEYRWFANGSPNPFSPIGTGRTLGQVFPAGGFQSFRLEVTDDGGNVAQFSGSINLGTVTPPYYIAKLPTLGGLQSCSFDINAAGNVVGNAEGPGIPPANHLALFTMDGSQVISMGTKGTAFALARTINDNNVAAGFWKTDQNRNRAVRSFFDGTKWVTEELPLVSPDHSPVAFNINNAGTIVGATSDIDYRIFVWKCPDPAGSTKLCPTGQMVLPLPGTVSRARGINNQNQIVGMTVNAGIAQGFLWKDNGNSLVDPGELINLGFPSTHPFRSSEAYAINERGQIVGTANRGGAFGSFPFIITPQNGNYFVDAGDGTNALIKELGRLGSGLDYALDLNESGVVVGKSGMCGDIFKTHGFVHVDGGLFDINQLVAPQGDWILESAEGINDLGEIAGWGHTTDRAVHGFVMTPIVPGAPAALPNPGATRSSITLGWKDLSRNELGFEIDRLIGELPADPTASDLAFQSLISLPADTTSYQDTTVSPGQKYSYRIRAFNENGMSDYHLWENIQTPTNIVPVAGNDAYATKEDRALEVPAPGLLANDGDADSDPIQLAAIAIPPTHGRLSSRADGSFRYFPDDDYFGADTFEYEIVDGFGGTARGTATLTMASVADAPVAHDDDYEVIRTKLLEVPAPGVLRNDRHPDGKSLKARLLTAPKHGRVQLRSDGAFVYVPKGGYRGDDQFSYEAKDHAGRKDSATVTLHIVSSDDD